LLGLVGRGTLIGKIYSPISANRANYGNWNLPKVIKFHTISSMFAAGLN
jgi:hypothetical protein